MANIPEGVTPDMLDQLLSNPGSVVGNNTDSQTFEAPSSVDITVRADQAVRPQVGGHTAGKERIRRPSSQLPLKLAEGDQQRRDLEQKRVAEERELRAQIDPIKMVQRINYLERQLKKQASEINKLKKDHE